MCIRDRYMSLSALKNSYLSWSIVSEVNALLKSMFTLVERPVESASNVGDVLNSAARSVSYCF